MKIFDDDEDDEDVAGTIPAEAAGVALHRSIKRKDDEEDDEDVDPDGSGDVVDGLDEDDIEALGG